MGEHATSIATSFDYGVPIDVQLHAVAEAGFTHFSLGANESHSGYLTVEGRRRLRALAQAHGLGIDTIHGPRADLPQSPAALRKVVRAAAELGVPVVVIHGGPFDFAHAELEGRLQDLLGVCRGLEPTLTAAGVQLALENVLPGVATELICLAVEALDPATFGFCYDSSHEQIGGPRPIGLLTRLQKRLIAVQLSDRIRDFVDHVLPGEGFVDWGDVCAALHQAHFDRPLLLEVAATHSAVKDRESFLRIAQNQAAQLARWVAHPEGDRALPRVK
jgi:sugar phosphate isomerase/epimerase